MADEDAEDSAQTAGLTTANTDPNRPAPRGTQRSPSEAFKARLAPGTSQSRLRRHSVGSTYRTG